MARSARIKEAYGTYYVTQTSSGCRPLFQNDDDRQYFIGILQKIVNKFNCKVIDYCAQSNNTYHMIIDVNGGDLSKIMKSINIPYAMHAACDGKLFKDRYKSLPIASDQDLASIRSKIKEETASDLGFSSFCLSEIIPCNDLEDTLCLDCISCTDQAREHINERAISLNLTLEELMKDKARRNLLIKELRRSSTLSLKSIGQVFDGLSESTVSKILNT